MTESGDPALIGRTIAGKFVVEKYLGGGAMGAVYRARQVALEKNVAVKVMHRGIALDPSFAGRFHREAKAASRLDHPNSMRVIDFGEEPDGLLYIAMEYLEGRDLYKVIFEDWPLSNERITDILMQALAAIAVAHDMGVIHRDLKPENIMILRGKDDEGRAADVVKVCDFGIAKITEADPVPSAAQTSGQKLTTQGLVVGTPEYMSPEQARGEKLDSRSDIYSMGVILYQLLTGKVPFSGDTPLATVLQHLTTEPELPRTIYESVHPGLEAACLKAIAKDREARHQSAREMRSALRAALENRPAPRELALAPTAPIGASGASPSQRPGAPGGTMPIGTAAGGSPDARGGRSDGGVVATAPTVMGVAPPTPLTGEAAPRPKQRSFVVPILAIAALGALALGASRWGLFPRAKGHRVEGVSPDAPTSASSKGYEVADPIGSSGQAVSSAHVNVVPSSTIPRSGASPAFGGSTTSMSTVDRAEKPIRSGRRGAGSTTSEPPSTGGTPTAPSPPPAPTDQGPSSPNPITVDPPSPATATPTPPPAPPSPPEPAFNPATCRAQVGPASANGLTLANTLSMRGTDAAWTRCAQNGIRDRLAGPVSARVKLRFGDNRAFKGASCTGCPGAVGACIASSTAPTVSVNFHGEVTGDPEYSVPVTFTCN